MDVRYVTGMDVACGLCVDRTLAKCQPSGGNQWNSGPGQWNSGLTSGP